MQIDVSPATADETKPLRDLHRHEMNCQIVLDSWHGRGLVDNFLCRIDGHIVGYGLVGGVHGNNRHTVTEFFVLQRWRGSALAIFRRLVHVSGARDIEVQTNDRLLTLMCYDCAVGIESNVVLFHDGFRSNLTIDAGRFRSAAEMKTAVSFKHKVEPEGDWVIDLDGEVVATGGILFHYNVPYGDLYMEVAEAHRRRCFGSYLIQELKRVCYEMGRIPAARCNAANAASRATLQKAGMIPCARVLTATIRPDAADSERIQ